MKISERYRKSVISKKFDELLSRGFIGYLITNRRYVKSVVSKRFIELLIMDSIGYLLIFVCYFPMFTTGTGTLSQINGIWCIDDYNSDQNILIGNPVYFPHILIPENDGKEVCFVAIYSYFFPSYASGVKYDDLIFLDTIQVFTIKQNLIIILASIISSAILIYLIRNYKYFLIINTIKKQKVKPVAKKTFNNLINANHYT
ncbi:hypothetical protein ES705_03823 [subsurface metagenome]